MTRSAANVSSTERFFHGVPKEDIYPARRAFEAGFVSAAHTGC